MLSCDALEKFSHALLIGFVQSNKNPIHFFEFALSKFVGSQESSGGGSSALPSPEGPGAVTTPFKLLPYLYIASSSCPSLSSPYEAQALLHSGLVSTDYISK